MSAVTVYQGLAERFATVDGIKAIILGEPTSAQDTPLIYTAFAEFTRPMAGVAPSNSTLTAMDYVFAHRLIIQWVDNAQAETEVLSFLNVIPAAIDADPKLGGRLTAGMARVLSARAGFDVIGGTLYRMVEFRVGVLEKAPRSQGI